MLPCAAPRLHRLSIGLGLALFAVLATGAGEAGAQSLSGFNSNAPVDYAADSIVLQDKANRVVLAGNVDITQGDLKLRAARTTVAYTDNGGVKIQRIDATGGVTVTRGGQTARGDVAVYDFNRRVITMAGNVSLNRGTDTLNGGRLVIDLNSGLASVDGRGTAKAGSAAPGGRVSGSFSVPKKN
ncbi:LptA/OstA family protein [Novosphingobium piscinae]|uniref:LptA/OstA family protein n=1 Tax=Novosphingobium piscinae TaxID=1507448 RepID=A0A7X1KR35_9SPHN|nr:LptA/OstA family protein [Novosphingobium piscinae]MBC2670213.1 LptA/OstA family protein [Novosphingobium piscinae]